MGSHIQLGGVEKEFSFRPRVRYGKTILSPATWQVQIKEIKHLFSIEEKGRLMLKAKEWREKRFLPRYVLMPDGDNELYVDWESVISLQSLFSIIKNREVVIFTEFVFEPENAIVKDKKEGVYLNECIVTFYKGDKV